MRAIRGVCDVYLQRPSDHTMLMQVWQPLLQSLLQLSQKLLASAMLRHQLIRVVRLAICIDAAQTGFPVQPRVSIVCELKWAVMFEHLVPPTPPFATHYMRPRRVLCHHSMAASPLVAFELLAINLVVLDDLLATRQQCGFKVTDGSGECPPFTCCTGCSILLTVLLAVLIITA